MTDIRCTYVLTRGPRKDQVCNSPKGVKSFNGTNYCYEHLRGKAIQQDLIKQGFSLDDITRPAPLRPSSSASPPDSHPPIVNKLQQPVKPRPIPKPVAEKPPKAAEIKSPDTFKSGWIDSFKSGLEEESVKDDIDFNRLYDDVDAHQTTPSSDICKLSPVPARIELIETKDEPEDSDSEDYDSDDEEPRELPDHLKQSPEDKAHIGQFCSKQIIGTGINAMALIAEAAFKPNLNGLQDNVMTNDALNKVVDQLAIEYNEMLGIGELSPTMQLFLCLSIVSFNTYTLNTFVAQQPPSKIPLMVGMVQPELKPPQQQQPSSFAPAYSE